jgi:hypothetical protein
MRGGETYSSVPYSITILSHLATLASFPTAWAQTPHNETLTVLLTIILIL